MEREPDSMDRAVAADPAMPEARNNLGAALWRKGELLRAERNAEDAGLSVIGVFHSHTHSEPYPSPTDVAQAPDPDWHYVIVSLKREAPEARSYRIVDGAISSVPIAIA